MFAGGGLDRAAHPDQAGAAADQEIAAQQVAAGGDAEVAAAVIGYRGRLGRAGPGSVARASDSESAKKYASVMGAIRWNDTLCRRLS